MGEDENNLVATFAQNHFVPLSGPFSIFRNCHWQTIVGSEAVRTKIFGDYPRTFETTTERISTPDGDFFDIEFTNNVNHSDKIVIIIHGLESSTKGPLVTKMTTSFLRKNFSCCLISFRGCNGEDNNLPVAYHLGFTDDAYLVLSLIRRRYPSMSIYLAGFSLGGNVMLKLISKLTEEDLKLFMIKGAVASCVPFDPVKSSPKLDVGFNRFVYSESFLSTLKRKMELKHQRFPGAINIEAARKVRSLGEFDDLVLAPLYGFRDKDDYYRQTGSKWCLNKIRVPTIVINALDDPFMDRASLPGAADIGPDAPVRLIYHEYGGHCGFMSAEAVRDDEGTPVAHGWLAEEMGRVLHHFDQRQHATDSRAAETVGEGAATGQQPNISP